MEAYFSQISEIIIEYAIAKVCSMLRVGPLIKLDLGFDLVCYRNCIEFFMEKCVPLEDICGQIPVEEIEKRLKFCVATIHAHHFVHRDIKPSNIVYSIDRKMLMLCDFGVS